MKRMKPQQTQCVCDSFKHWKHHVRDTRQVLTVQTSQGFSFLCLSFPAETLILSTCKRKDLIRCFTWLTLTFCATVVVPSSHVSHLSKHRVFSFSFFSYWCADGFDLIEKSVILKLVESAEAGGQAHFGVTFSQFVERRLLLFLWKTQRNISLTFRNNV